MENVVLYILLRSHSSVGECLLDMQEVGGSKPPGTIYETAILYGCFFMFLEHFVR